MTDEQLVGLTTAHVALDYSVNYSVRAATYAGVCVQACPEVGMPEQTSMMEHEWTPIREMRAGDRVDLVALVRERETRQKRDGSDWFQLTIADRTGETTVKVWSDSAGYRLAVDGEFQPGQPVRVRGQYIIDERYGAEVVLKGDGSGCRPAQPDEVIWDRILDGPERSVEELEAHFQALIESVGEFGDPVRDLVVTVFEKCWDDFRMAPAAVGNHQPYRHGLLEHTLNVAQTAAAIAGVYPDVDRDVIVAGALLHDVGKIDVYTLDPLRRDVTDAGRLFGEIPASHYRVRRATEHLWPNGLPDGQLFPREVAHVLHIVSSHHGQIDWGAAVTPCTREAFIVHYADMVDSRAGGFERVAKKTAQGESWSGYDRGVGGRMWLQSSDSVEVEDPGA